MITETDLTSTAAGRIRIWAGMRRPDARTATGQAGRFRAGHRAAVADRVLDHDNQA